MGLPGFSPGKKTDWGGIPACYNGPIMFNQNTCKDMLILTITQKSRVSVQI